MTILKKARTAHQKTFNRRMTGCRVSVEWCSSGVMNKFTFIKCAESLKIGPHPVALMISAMAMLTNSMWFSERSQISQYFDVLPPFPADYLHTELPKHPCEYTDDEGVALCPDLVRQLWMEASRVLKEAQKVGDAQEKSASDLEYD